MHILIGGIIHFWCICLPNLVPVLTPVALICCIMPGTFDGSSVTCMGMGFRTLMSPIVSDDFAQPVNRFCLQPRCSDEGEIRWCIDVYWNIAPRWGKRGWSWQISRCIPSFFSKLWHKWGGNCMILVNFIQRHEGWLNGKLCVTLGAMEWHVIRDQELTTFSVKIDRISFYESMYVGTPR